MPLACGFTEGIDGPRRSFTFLARFFLDCSDDAALDGEVEDFGTGARNASAIIRSRQERWSLAATSDQLMVASPQLKRSPRL